MTIQRLSHLGICVTELERATAFYCNVFGFEQRSSLNVRGRAADQLMGLTGVKMRAVYLERDGFRLELLSFRAPCVLEQGLRELNRAGLTHLSFRVTDIDQTLAQVELAGGTILAQTRVEEAGFKSVFVLDPSNTRIELIEAAVDSDWLPGMPL